MTADEIRMARALGASRFVPATFDKRFAGIMAARALHAHPEISERESYVLHMKVVRYRRQIAVDVVALAREGLSRFPPLA